MLLVTFLLIIFICLLYLLFSFGVKQAKGSTNSRSAGRSTVLTPDQGHSCPWLSVPGFSVVSKTEFLLWSQLNSLINGVTPVFTTLSALVYILAWLLFPHITITQKMKPCGEEGETRVAKAMIGKCPSYSLSKHPKRLRVPPFLNILCLYPHQRTPVSLRRDLLSGEGFLL